MRASQLFGTTLRAAPADELLSHQLLLRAGFVQQLATGIFSLLPIGWRTEQKLRTILREEMDALGGQQLSMPVVHPGELWQRSGRWDKVDSALVRFQDRRGRDMALAMTHEEVVADLAATAVSSYRDLPRIIYQIQTKFRDEPRARGGLLRTREFTMKDAYSLDRDQAGLRRAYIAHFGAYFRIAARAGIPVVAVVSDVGIMGGQLAHEFIYLSDSGEDTLVFCAQCGYAANQEVAEAALDAPETEAEAALEEVATPGATTVEDVASLLGVAPSRIAKTVAYLVDGERNRPARLVLALVPGEAEVNLARLRRATGAVDARPARAEEIRAAGAVPGFMSPLGLAQDGVTVVADEALSRRRNLITGANREGWHLRNFNLARDAPGHSLARLAEVRPHDPCSNCGGPLDLRRGIEYGNIFQLGTTYSESMGIGYTDETGEQQPLVMGSYGIGLGRLLACVAEEHHDERGLTLPLAVAPYQVALVSVGREPEVTEAADTLYRDLDRAGVEVLYDDRELSPGVKFADADLRGIPLRVTVSPRALAAASVEIKRRHGDARLVAATEATGAIREELAEMAREAQQWLDRQLAPLPGLLARTFGAAG